MKRWILAAIFASCVCAVYGGGKPFAPDEHTLLLAGFDHGVERADYSVGPADFMGIGMTDDIISITEGCKTLCDDTKLLCFTDGIVEMEREGIPDYGQSVVERSVRDSRPIKETIHSLLSELNIQRSNTALLDDVTLLGIDFFINKKTL